MVLEAELVCYRGPFANAAEFDAYCRNCLYVLKIIKVEVFSVQGLSGCIYRSLLSLVPRMFIRDSPE